MSRFTILRSLPYAIVSTMPWRQLYFSLEGRATRRDFWLRFWVPFLLTWIAVTVILPPVGVLTNDLTLEAVRANPWAMLTPLGYALLILSNVAFAVVAVKRLHDRNLSGSFLLLFYVPPLGERWLAGNGLVDQLLDFILSVCVLWICIALGFLRGTSGPNRFGPNPRQALENV